MKDVLVTGLFDDDIKKEVMGWAELDKKGVQNTVGFIEAKEMACDAQIIQSVAGVSAYREKSKGIQKATSSPSVKNVRSRWKSSHGIKDNTR